MGGQGRSAPIHNLTPLSHTNIQKEYKKLLFSTFDLITLDGPMNQWTDKASYRFANPRLETCKFENRMEGIR